MLNKVNPEAVWLRWGCKADKTKYQRQHGNLSIVQNTVLIYTKSSQSHTKSRIKFKTWKEKDKWGSAVSKICTVCNSCLWTLTNQWRFETNRWRIEQLHSANNTLLRSHFHNAKTLASCVLKVIFNHTNKNNVVFPIVGQLNVAGPIAAIAVWEAAFVIVFTEDTILSKHPSPVLGNILYSKCSWRGDNR